MSPSSSLLYQNQWITGEYLKKKNFYKNKTQTSTHQQKSNEVVVYSETSEFLNFHNPQFRCIDKIYLKLVIHKNGLEA